MHIYNKIHILIIIFLLHVSALTALSSRRTFYMLKTIVFMITWACNFYEISLKPFFNVELKMLNSLCKTL